MHSIRKDDGRAALEPRFRTVPLNEFINRVTVPCLGIDRAQAVENSGFCLVQVR